MRETIDVVMPLRNDPTNVVAAIRSALDQTFPVNKVIVADDGSTDASPEVVRSAFAGDERVVLLSLPHMGRSAARNRAISVSEADCIAFLDSDDVWIPTKLEKQTALLGKDGVGAVYCGYSLMTESGRPLPTAEVIAPRLRGDVFAELFEGNKISGSCSAVLTYRRLLLEVGSFDPDLDFGEDWDVWLKLAKKTKFDFVDEALVALRLKDNPKPLGPRSRRRQFLQHLKIWSRWPDAVLGDARLLSFLVKYPFVQDRDDRRSFRRSFIVNRSRIRLLARYLPPAVIERLNEMTRERSLYLHWRLIRAVLKQTIKNAASRMSHRGDTK